ncbi:MAG TPA: hypothetical protein DIU00_19115 [Phycisphaerales bacterium]|nr:hypothetical protein [Phycisphaerales bacterium]
MAAAKDADTDFNIYYCAADRALGKTMLGKQQGYGVDAIASLWIHSSWIPKMATSDSNPDRPH